ncbi:hypothetical protein PRIPAC_81811 [Pristionchus pacificus]|uniref:Fibronectin domain-containing protein n=1 Tax=Pristionchus pacificus TaxID=54126 RepID=A0A2A6BHX5_PRIPA|nr:hypothetical protein PRIPAC_81811 [Pristionchus pacificus]|eukprot:PDM65411.1 Fibronectin domain-containing protein [Pristionchus pacificus]
MNIITIKMSKSYLNRLCGQNVEWDVPVRGEPPPEKVWTDHSDRSRSRHRIRGGTKTDPCRYQTPTFWFQVPDDDGGMPIDHYEIEKMDTGRWVPVGRSEVLWFGTKPSHFRVRAVNKVGESEALTTASTILAKNPYDTPEKMDVPEVTDWDAVSVVASWLSCSTTPSTHNGPLKIVNVTKDGCDLDWQAPGIRWMDRYRKLTTVLHVDNLTPGHEYKFRVKAVSRYGDSDPFEGNKSIIAKDPFDTANNPGPPDIIDWDTDHTDLQWTPCSDDRAAPIEGYLMEYKAGPVGDCIAGLQLRIKAINKAGQSSPSDSSRTLVNSGRNDSGTYKIVATNEVGKNEAEMYVNVLDVPGESKGPLKENDVKKDGCVHNWRPPEDDGGMVPGS